MGLGLGQGNRLWDSRVASPVGRFDSCGSLWEHKVCFLLGWEVLGALSPFCLALRPWQHSVLVSLLHRGTLISACNQPQPACRQDLVLCGPLLGTTGFSDSLTPGHLSAPQLQSSCAGFLR